MSGSNLPGQAGGSLANTEVGSSYITDQWIRKWTLVVYNPTTIGPSVVSPGGFGGVPVPSSGGAPGQALVLSAGSDVPGSESLRVRFEVRNTMIPTPNQAVIRVYNPSPQIVYQATQEFVRVTLEAGYLNGRFGTIFDGWITQFRFGGETAVDKYLEIYAQDGDLAFSHTFLSQVLMPGFNSPRSIGEAIASAMYDKGVVAQPLSELSPVPTARPVVIYGMAVDHLDVVTRTTNTIWSINQGKLTVVPAPGTASATEVYDINALTGLIGFPSLTNDGLEFRTLLNPFASYGQQVRINNSEINQVRPGVGGFTGSGFGTAVTPSFGLRYYATPSDDNLYFVANVSFIGDTRGQEWYTDYIAITIDPTSNKFMAGQETFPSTAEILTQMGMAGGPNGNQ